MQRDRRPPGLSIVVIYGQKRTRIFGKKGCKGCNTLPVGHLEISENKICLPERRIPEPKKSKGPLDPLIEPEKEALAKRANIASRRGAKFPARSSPNQSPPPSFREAHSK